MFERDFIKIIDNQMFWEPKEVKKKCIDINTNNMFWWLNFLDFETDLFLGVGCKLFLCEIRMWINDDQTFCHKNWKLYQVISLICAAQLYQQ